MTGTDFAPVFGGHADVTRITRARLDNGFLPVHVTEEAKAELEVLLYTTAAEMLGATPDMAVFASALHRLSRPCPAGFGVPSKVLADVVRRRAADLAKCWQRNVCHDGECEEELGALCGNCRSHAVRTAAVAATPETEKAT